MTLSLVQTSAVSAFSEPLPTTIRGSIPRGPIVGPVMFWPISGKPSRATAVRVKARIDTPLSSTRIPKESLAISSAAVDMPRAVRVLTVSVPTSYTGFCSPRVRHTEAADLDSYAPEDS